MIFKNSAGYATQVARHVGGHVVGRWWLVAGRYMTTGYASVCVGNLFKGAGRIRKPFAVALLRIYHVLQTLASPPAHGVSRDQ